MRGLSPSVISADFGRLEESLKSVEPWATSWHVDVMDGHHVPNLTIGPMFVEAIRRISVVRQDVHLMITNPDSSWEWYRRAGAARIAFHPDQSDDAAALAKMMAAAGVGPGIAVSPEVEPEEVRDLLDVVDHVIVMSVHPGFSGQKFLPSALPKAQKLRRWCDDMGGHFEIVVDGGVNEQTAPACMKAGADVLVSASAIFGSPDPAAAAARLRLIADSEGPRADETRGGEFEQ